MDIVQAYQVPRRYVQVSGISVDLARVHEFYIRDDTLFVIYQTYDYLRPNIEYFLARGEKISELYLKLKKAQEDFCGKDLWIP